MKELYKILLVDDEDEVRGRIESRISHESGFKVVGKAGNGYDAIELIEQTKPDVVLTDIKMPFIDGVELARIIRRDYPMIRVAFITGYDEFNYAQNAIELKVVKYLMKPITSKDINDFLSELKVSLDKEYEQMQNMLVMKEKYDELLPIIGDSFLSSLIYARTLSTYHIQKLKLYGIDPTNYSEFLTCLVQVQGDKTMPLKELEQLKVNTNEIFKTIFKHSSFKHSLLVADGLVFLFTTDNMSKNQADQVIFELIEAAKEYIHAEITVGVSKPYKDFKSFPDSYHQSRRALAFANTIDFGSIVYADEVTNMKNDFLSISFHDYFTLDQLIHYGDEEAFFAAVDEMKMKLSQEEFALYPEQLKIQISHLLMYLANQADVSLSEIYQLELIDEMRQLVSIEELLAFMEEGLKAIKSLDLRKQISRSEQLTKSAMHYIDEHFEEPSLSLETLSDYLNVSISHLSMLFKKHSGYTFSKYLIKVRMEKAKELLKSSDIKIVDVSILCGYSEVYYFSHSFKKYTGVSPRKFRQDELV